MLVFPEAKDIVVSEANVPGTKEVV